LPVLSDSTIRERLNELVPGGDPNSVHHCSYEFTAATVFKRSQSEPDGLPVGPLSVVIEATELAWVLAEVTQEIIAKANSETKAEYEKFREKAQADVRKWSFGWLAGALVGFILALAATGAFIVTYLPRLVDEYGKVSQQAREAAGREIGDLQMDIERLKKQNSNLAEQIQKLLKRLDDPKAQSGR
jgi:hypothetical protein